MTFCGVMCAVTSYFLEKSCHRFKSVNDTRDEEDTTGKVVVVTGASDGIGKETALQMAKRGAIVVMGCRDVAKASSVANEIKQQCPSAQLHVVQLDLANLSSVRGFARSVTTQFDRIHILINNAGLMLSKRKPETTKDGFEMQMGVNHLGHVLLTLLLLDNLKKAAPSRIVFVSSLMQQCAQLRLDDLMCEKPKSWGFYNYLPYCNSKLAMSLYAKGLAKRLEGTGVHTYALCPGVVKTRLMQKGTERGDYRPCRLLLRSFADINVEKGVETTLYCSLSTKCASESGCLYHFGHRWKIKVFERASDEFVENLMKLSEDLVGYRASNNGESSASTVGVGDDATGATTDDDFSSASDT